MIELNRIYHENCMEGMKRIPDSSVDLIICDLPYGVLNKYNEAAAWDRCLPMDELWKEYLRVAKPNAAIILFGQGMFTAELMLSQPKLWRYNMIWKKGNRITGFLNVNKMPLRNHEDICVFYRKQPTYHPQMTFGSVCHQRNKRTAEQINRCWGKITTSATTISHKKYPVSILDFPKDHPAVHPTQKPVALVAWLINTYSNPGETVLDNCGGSCTTAEAAVMTDRKFIVFEWKKEFVDIGNKRVQKARMMINSRIEFK